MWPPGGAVDSRNTLICSSKAAELTVGDSGHIYLFMDLFDPS